MLAVPVVAGEITGYGGLPREGLTIIGSMALVALPLPKYPGFDPSGYNGPEQIQALSLVYVLPPLLFYAISVAIIARYPVSSARLIKLRSAFDRRDSRRAESGQAS